MSFTKCLSSVFQKSHGNLILFIEAIYKIIKLTEQLFNRTINYKVFYWISISTVQSTTCILILETFELCYEIKLTEKLYNNYDKPLFCPPRQSIL